MQKILSYWWHHFAPERHGVLEEFSETIDTN